MKSNKMGFNSRRSANGFLDSLFGIRKKSTLRGEITFNETSYPSRTARGVLLKAEESRTRAIDCVRKLQNR